MSESTYNVLISGLMGIFGGMITIPINGLISGFFKHEEQLYQHQLDVIKMKKEKTLQHQMDIELQKMNNTTNEDMVKLKSEVAQLLAAVARLAEMAQR